MAKKSQIMYEELFPNGDPPGSPNYATHFLDVTPAPEGYTIGGLSRQITEEGIERSNDPENPINTKVLSKYGQTTATSTKPVTGKRKVVHRLKKDEEKPSVVEEPTTTFEAPREPVVPAKLPEKPPQKRARFIVKESPITEVIRPFGVGGNTTTPPVRRTEGEIQVTPSGLTFYKIAPLRLESDEITTPMDGLDFPAIVVPIRAQFLPTGRAAYSRPIVKAGVKSLESHKAGELSSVILRDIDETKLSEQRHSGNNQYYSNKEIETFAHILGITAQSREDRVKMIKEKIAAMKEKK